MVNLRRQFVIPFLSICCLVSGCDSGVTFREPQPVSGERIETLPERIHGEYISKLSGAHINVEDKSIIKTIEWSGMMAKGNLDSSYHLLGNMMVSNDGNERYPVQFIGDSFKISIHLQDTIFTASDKNVIKKFKGYFFVNKRIDSTRWDVTKLSFEKGILSIGKISSSVDIDKLRQLSETTDSTNYSFNPTQKQFRRFIKQGGFSDEEQFFRIKR